MPEGRGFVSRRQWRWAFSTGQPWARRWARETPGGEGARFRRLPATKAEPAENAESGAGRKPMTPQERARHAALVRWGKKNPLAARLMALREKKKAKGGGSKPAAPKPDKAAEKEKQAAENRAKAYEALGLFEDATAALDALRKGEAVDDDGGLVKLGLAEQAADGTYRLTAAGRSLYAAASRGDVGAARDVLSKAKDRAAQKEPEAAPDKEGEPIGNLGAALSKQKDAEKPKKGGGGGGGGGKEEKPKPTTDDKEKARDAERAKATAEAVRAAGLKPADLDDLRAAAESGGVASPRLRDLGLVGEDGQTTDQGRRALSALERGDVRGYRAALQDVEAARGRTAARDKAKAERDKERADREAAREQARADREKERADVEARELDDLADDFRRGRRGLTFEQQRRLIRAGRARLNGERFELKAQRLTPRQRRLLKRTARGDSPPRMGRLISRGLVRERGDGFALTEAGREAVKHGKHNQASHGRRTARRRAYQSAYRDARAGGADPATARATARAAGEARQGERDARLARLQGRAQDKKNDPFSALPRKDNESNFAYEMRLLEAEEDGRITMAQRDAALRQLQAGQRTTADPAAVARLRADRDAAQSRLSAAASERERAERDLINAQIRSGDQAAARARRRAGEGNRYGLSGDGRSENTAQAARVREARARLDQATANEEAARRAVNEVYRNYGDLEIAAASATKDTKRLALELDLLEIDA